MGARLFGQPRQSDVCATLRSVHERRAAPVPVMAVRHHVFVRLRRRLVHWTRGSKLDARAHGDWHPRDAGHGLWEQLSFTRRYHLPEDAAGVSTEQRSQMVARHVVGHFDYGAGLALRRARRLQRRGRCIGVPQAVERWAPSRAGGRAGRARHRRSRAFVATANTTVTLNNGVTNQVGGGTRLVGATRIAAGESSHTP